MLFGIEELPDDMEEGESLNMTSKFATGDLPDLNKLDSAMDSKRFMS